MNRFIFVVGGGGGGYPKNGKIHNKKAVMGQLRYYNMRIMCTVLFLCFNSS